MKNVNGGSLILMLLNLKRTILVIATEMRLIAKLLKRNVAHAPCGRLRKNVIGVASLRRKKMNRGLTLDEFLEQGHVFSGGEEGGDEGFVGSDGTFNDGWTGRDEFKDDADTLGRYKTVGELAKGHMELRKKFSKNPDTMVEIPSEGSDDAVRAAFARANGVPETVDEYKYEYSDDFAAKLGPLDDTKIGAIKEFAHKELGLSNAKFQKLLDFYHTNTSSDTDAFNTELKESTNQRFEAGTALLKAQWLDGTDDRTKAALAHLQKYGEFEVKGADGENVNPLEKLLEEAPQLKQSPWLTMIMDNMAKKMGEAGRKGGGDAGALSLDGINTQIADIRAKQNAIRKTNPVNFKGDPEFKRHEESLKALYQKKPA